MVNANKIDIDSMKHRPLITFALLAYNQEQYIKEAVLGALSQNYSPIEIILSDDCSTDDTFNIMKSIVADYKGDISIKLTRNYKNLGLALHFSNIIEQSNGDFIVIAAGDDISLASRSSETAKIMIQDASINFVDVGAIQIDVLGNEISLRTFESRAVELKDFIAAPPHGLNGAGRTYRKSALLAFSHLNESCPTEDTTSLLRCLLGGRGYILNKQLMKYRLHDGSLSAEASLMRMKIDEITQQYLRDIYYAERSEYIDRHLSGKLMSWAVGVGVKRKFLQDAKKKGISILKCISVILFSKNITFWSRLAILKIYAKYIISSSGRGH